MIENLEIGRGDIAVALEYKDGKISQYEFECSDVYKHSKRIKFRNFPIDRNIMCQGLKFARMYQLNVIGNRVLMIVPKSKLDKNTIRFMKNRISRLKRRGVITEIGGNATNCRNCTFAVYHNQEGYCDGKWQNRLVQIGCSFNQRTDRFKEQNLLINARDLEQDFFVINRHCNAFTVENVDFHTVRERIKPKIDIILNAIRYKSHNISAQVDKVVRLIELSDKLKNANSIIMVNNDVQSRYLYTALGEIGPKYFLTHLQESQPYGNIPDHVFNHLTGSYFIYARLGHNIDFDLIQKNLDYIVNDELRTCLYSYNNDMMVCNKQFYKTIKGNSPVNTDFFDPDVESPVTLYTAYHKFDYLKDKRISVKMEELCRKRE